MASNVQIDAAARYFCETVFSSKWESIRKDGRARDPSGLSAVGFPPWYHGTTLNAHQEDFRDIVRGVLALTEDK